MSAAKEIVRHHVRFFTDRTSVFHRSQVVVSRLEFDVADPAKVTLLFPGQVDHRTGKATHWSVTRDGLAQGVVREVVEGDLTIRPALLGIVPAVAFVLDGIDLTTGDDWAAQLRIPSSTVRKFLAATYRLIPASVEELDWDAFLTDCLKETS